MLITAAVIVGSYVIGAVPIAYLTGRALKGVDLRRYGSGNIGPSNIWQNVSKPATVPVGLAEISQGALGILIAKAAGQGLSVQVAAGLAALLGHNWSPFIGFYGGRGVGHAIGFMLVLSWPGLGAFIGFSLLGVALRAVPQLVGLGLLVTPIVALAAGQSRAIVAGLAAMAALIFAKRLLGNAPAVLRRDVLLNRLLYDRDTRERERWLRGERVS
jgi:acyl phosphate:glycerol-3-phosphate acyltransferase